MHLSRVQSVNFMALTSGLLISTTHGTTSVSSILYSSFKRLRYFDFDLEMILRGVHDVEKNFTSKLTFMTFHS